MFLNLLVYSKNYHSVEMEAVGRAHKYMRQSSQANKTVCKREKSKVMRQTCIINCNNSFYASSCHLMSCFMLRSVEKASTQGCNIVAIKGSVSKWVQ